ncbi:hypothetical protein KKH03_01910, partial [Patescibacteria group bacterium]|nr:hypothetical protein [Patescibacteria group bacterium]
MRTNCIALSQDQHKSFFNPKRLVFKAISHSEKSPERSPEALPAGRPETLRSKYEKEGVEQKIKTPVQIKDKIIKNTLAELAKKIDNNPSTTSQLINALSDSWSNSHNIKGDLSDYWAEVLAERNCTISIVKKDGKWVFEIKYPDGTPAIPKLSACPIDAEPEAKPTPPEAMPPKREGVKEAPAGDLIEKLEKRTSPVGPIEVGQKDITETITALSGQIDNNPETKTQLYSFLVASWGKTGYSTEALLAYWPGEVIQNNCTISLSKTARGNWAFTIKKPDGTDMLNPMELERFKRKQEIQEQKPEPAKKAPSAKPTQKAAAAKAPKTSPELKEAAPAKKKAIRKIDKNAEAKEEEKAKKETEEKRVHEIVFQNKEDVSGRLLVPKDKKERAEIGVVLINLEKIYPNARKGDRVSITAYEGEQKRVAIFDGEKFVYERPAALKNQPVKVLWNYRLQFTPDQYARDKDKEKPRAPENTPVAGYFRVKKDMSWTNIAKIVMRTQDVPDGRDIKSSPETGPKKNSPAAQLLGLGYKADNAEDVAAYAKLLEQGNKGEKLYVWAIIPKKENPRAARERQEAEKAKYSKEALKRTKGREETRRLEYNKIMARHFRNMDENKEYKIDAKLIDIVNDDDLWNYYWEEGKFEEVGQLTGMKQIRDGFKMLGVPMEKQRDVLLDAIQQSELHAENIDFEDLLDAFNHKDLNVYRTREKESGSHKDFHDELLFYQIATKIKNGKETTSDQKKYYEENYKEYVTETGIVDVQVKYEYLVNILKGSALILDGLQNIKPGVSVEYAKASMEAKAERPKAAEEKEREPWRAQSEEDIFLQKFFHPLSGKPVEEITSAEELEEGKSDFQNQSSEETAYRMIRVQSADEKDPNKIDRNRMINVMNSYIRMALINFFTQKQLLDEKGEGNASEIQKISQRYFGKYGLEKLQLSRGKQSEMDWALEVYKIKDIGEKVNEDFTVRLRNMLQDGFLAERQVANGEIKLGEEIKEVKDWTSYGAILEKTKNPASKETVQNLLATQPKFAQLPKEELEKAIMDIDGFMSKNHDWQGADFEHKINDLEVKNNRLFDANAAVDASTGDWYMGLSKEILKIPGIDAGLALGIAVNPKTGEVLIGAIVAKEMEISKQWSASVRAGGGVEVTRPALTAGVGVGFTWMSKGTENSPWREKVDFGMGAGSSISFNLTDVYLGPYVYAGYGRKKDFQEQASKLYTGAYLNNRLDMVDAAKTPDEKVAALLRLPRGVGEFMTTIKYNLNWINEQMLRFYETQVKDRLKNISLSKAMESASGISEWGLGTTLEPVSLTLMAIAVATGNPAIITAATLGAFGRLGIITGSSIKVRRQLSDLTPAQIAYEKKVCEGVNKMFPTVEVSYEILRFSDMENISSLNFAGSDLQRVMGLPANIDPQNVEQTELHPDKTPNFKKLQEQFAANKLILGYDEAEKKYTITPAVTETYRLYIDPDIAAGHGLIINNDKIMVASRQDLSNLHIRRFDVFYPGYVDGTAQHTLIAITDNPYVKLTDLAEQNSYVEGKYDREHSVTGYPRKVGGQKNIFTFKEYSVPITRQSLYNAEQLGERAKMSKEALAKRQRSMELTARAFGIPKPLPEAINISTLPVSPERFIKMPKYERLYRQLTTNTNPKNIADLEGLIKKENPAIDENQMILYKERLFHLSMSEGKVNIETRLDWARNAVYLPFFRRQKERFPQIVPAEISAEDLADAFIEAVRFNLKNEVKSLEPGQSLFTAVGTFNAYGIRMVEAASGQNEQNRFIEGFDYAKFLDRKGAHATIEQRTIARLLLQQHSELPTEDTAFLRSRLAKKLFYMGSNEVPNPLIDILGEEKFEKLLAAYEAVENGQSAPTDSTEAIRAFMEVAFKVRAAQLGKGQPVLLDGNRPGRAVVIEGYIFVIETTLKSGLYEACKNPSVVYNENITVFKLSKLQQAKPGLDASVFSGAGDV